MLTSGRGEKKQRSRKTTPATAQVQAIAHYVFTHAFVDAMHPTMLLPIFILVLAACASVFVRGHKGATAAAHEEQAAVA